MKSRKRGNKQDSPIHTDTRQQFFFCFFFYDDGECARINHGPDKASGYPHTSGEVGGVVGELSVHRKDGCVILCCGSSIVDVRATSDERDGDSAGDRSLGNDVSGPGWSGHKAIIPVGRRSRNGSRHRRSGTGCGSILDRG